MKKLMMLLLSLVCISASIADANASSDTPVCPSLSKVAGVEFEEYYNYGGQYDYVAYYDDLLHLGTPSLWYAAEVNLTPQLESGRDKTDQVLDYAKNKLRYIDTQVNDHARVDSLYGIQLYVCEYKSSDANVKARLIAATPLENGYLLNATAQHNIAAGLAQLAR